MATNKDKYIELGHSFHWTEHLDCPTFTHSRIFITFWDTFEKLSQ